MIYKIVDMLKNKDISKWESIKYKVAKEKIQEIPETKVVEALRAYIDGVWAGPVEAKRLWNEVIKNLAKFDEFEVKEIENRIKRSRISDASDWRKA